MIAKKANRFESAGRTLKYDVLNRRARGILSASSHRLGVDGKRPVMTGSNSLPDETAEALSQTGRYAFEKGELSIKGNLAATVRGEKKYA